jgi:hypothetical protein
MMQCSIYSEKAHPAPSHGAGSRSPGRGVQSSVGAPTKDAPRRDSPSSPHRQTAKGFAHELGCR